MSEQNLTDQRPRTTTSEIPEEMRAKRKLPKDPVFEAQKDSFLAKLRERMDRRKDERRSGERRA